MAINFEAANMAGYNNPKIEVFEAVANPDTDAITSAPRKTDVFNSLNRGAIPIMLLTYPGGDPTVYVMLIHSVMSGAEGDTIYFSNGAIAVIYSPTSEQPTIGAVG